MRAACFAAIAGFVLAPPASGQDAGAPLPLCHGQNRVTCVVDGDTVWIEGEKIRLEGIDAPEQSSPECMAELELATRATARLAQILGSADWTISRNGNDNFGRTFGTFIIGETTAGEMVVAENLAHRWRGRQEEWRG